MTFLSNVITRSLLVSLNDVKVNKSISFISKGHIECCNDGVQTDASKNVTHCYMAYYREFL